MKRWILSWLLITVLTLYIANKSYKDKQTALIKLTHYEEMIQFKNKKLMDYQSINEKLLQEKVKTEKLSLELKKQLKRELEKTPCANELIPTHIANKLRHRVSQIRQFAEQ